MSDLWDQLVNRALSSEPAVRPRVPTLYERAGPPASVPAEEIEERIERTTPVDSAAAARSDGTPPGAKAIAPAAREPSPQPAAPLAATNDRPAIGPASHDVARRERPLVVEVPPSPRASASSATGDGASPAVTARSETGVRRPPATGTVTEKPPAERTWPPRPAVKETEEAISPHDASPVQRRTGGEPSPAVLDGPTDGRRGPPLAVSPIVVPVVSPAVPSAESRRRSQEERRERAELPGLDDHRPTMASAPPAVHVTIGRLEIRAVPPARVEPKPVVTAPPARLSLDEYLKRGAEVSR